MSKIFIHPLVIINIADHQAREVAECKHYDSAKPPRILGALFGVQKDQRVEVMNSVELPYKIDDEKNIRIDDDAFAEDTDLHKQIYPEHECLGWYSTCLAIQNEDETFHQRFKEYNESPLYLTMNPKISKQSKNLPINIYRMETKKKSKNDNNLVNVFVSLDYKIVSEPAERIATDEVLQTKDLATKGSLIEPEFEILSNAIDSLQQRIKLLIDYLNKIESNQIKPNDQILRNIQSVCNRLPTNTHEKFKNDFINEMSNGMMMTYLSSMTKTATKVNSTLNLYDQLNDGRGAGIGGPRKGGLRRFMND